MVHAQPGDAIGQRGQNFMMITHQKQKHDAYIPGHEGFLGPRDGEVGDATNRGYKWLLDEMKAKAAKA